MAIAALTIRFLCELALLGVLAWFGDTISGLAFAIGLPLAVAVVWGLGIAPKARYRLRDPGRLLIESVLWASGIAALVRLDRIALAIVFGVLAFATAVLARRYEPGVSKVDGSSRFRA